MSSRHRGVVASTAPSSSSNNPAYSSLASLRDKLRSTKITERRTASKELLETLRDSSMLRRLEREAERGFEQAVLRGGSMGGGGNRGGGGGGDPRTATLPRDRVCILYRSLMDAALLAARTVVEGVSPDNSSSAPRSRKRNHANHTGLTKRSVKFNLDDILFPYRVFLRMDADLALECCDGGYGGDMMNTPSEEDWKTRPRYGHHLDMAACSGGGGSATQQQQGQARFNATHYKSHTYTDQDRGSRLTSKEIIACVDYCIYCLNDDDCRDLGAEPTLLQWLVHICSRPEYLAALPYQEQLSHVLHELSVRLNRAFVDGHVVEKGILGTARDVVNGSSSSSGHRSSKQSGQGGLGSIPQESLLSAAKCLSAISYNCTTRLGMGMHLYIRPIVELVAVWAENAWQMQSEGEFASSSTSAATLSAAAAAGAARNPHSKMMESGQINPATHRRKLRTESDILALLPYLYSSVTHLLAAHPEQSVPIMGDHGHALLRLARRNFGRPATTMQTRDALGEYVGAHLLVAETSGKMVGLPEGDLGPLEPRRTEEDDDDDEHDTAAEDDEMNEENGSGKRGHKKKKRKKKRKRKGATLDSKSILKLLEMVRDPKVWEALFSASASGGGQDAKKKKRRSRRSLAGQKHSGVGVGGVALPEGGASWTPLSRRQRRHLELTARLVRIAQRYHVADAEDRGNGTQDSLESLANEAEEQMRASGIERGEIDIVPKGGSSSAAMASGGSENDKTHAATSAALACSPWLRFVCRHLYELNPKLGRLTSMSPTNALLTQDTHQFTTGSRHTQFTQGLQSSGVAGLATGREESGSSYERILLESCPMLQALVVDESALVEEAEATASTDVSMTQSTLNTTMTLTAPAKLTKAAGTLDSIKPTPTATLQLLCAAAECFPRGECWTSSARRGWSTVVDERSYPAGTLATVIERYGSSPADAAAVVYLLGTTLEAHGGSAGEEDVQLWTLVALLKMTESSAIICSREGLMDDADISSSVTSLRTAWQFVWNMLFRYDLRYASYTAGAFGSNAGELVLQLLTQIVRFGCADRDCLFLCKLPTEPGAMGLGTGSSSLPATKTGSLFVHAEQGKLWKLPVFENAILLFSPSPFELITSVIKFAGFSDNANSEVAALANANLNMASAVRDRQWFVSFCLQYLSVSLEVSSTESSVRRSYLPYAVTCLASLINGEAVASGVSTFELDALTRFAVTEDVELLNFGYNPDDLEVGPQTSVKDFYSALWADSVMSPEYLFGMDREGSQLRIVQGRGAFLNRQSDSRYERDRLRSYLNDEGLKLCAVGTGISPQTNFLCSMSYDKFKSCLDDLLFQLKYDDANADASDYEEDERGPVGSKTKDKSLTLPHLTCCLSLILTVLLSKHSATKQVQSDIVNVFDDTFGPSFDLLVEYMPLLIKRGCQSDLFAVLNNLHGIVTSLTFIAALGGSDNEGNATVPQIFGSRAKSLFIMCKSLLKEHRGEMYASGESSDQGISHNFDSDSDDDNHYGARHAQTQSSQIQRSSRPSNFSDDSDGLMNDDDDNNIEYRPRRQRAPPLKRRRLGNGSSKSRTKTNSSHGNNRPSNNSMDSRCAWACASFMLVLQPSFQTVELISGHLVWPEDYNGQVGYKTISKTSDPHTALVCATLFCRKSVILRRDRLDLVSGRGRDEDEDQESALILAVETILQARRSFNPSSKYFMSALGTVAQLVKIGEYSESCGPISTDESKVVLEALYPEGIGKESEDFFLLRQWTKRILKYRSSYRSQQIHAGTLSFLYAQKNLMKEFDNSFGSYFMFSSFRHIDENVRSLACNVLGAALIRYPDQNSIVSDVLKNALPRLDSDKKFTKWVDSLRDPKLRDELTFLEEEALSDAEDSIEHHAVESIGMIAGSVSDATLGRAMIWKLVDLAAKKPVMLLPCYRACKRASFLLGFRSVNVMFDNMMPHLLVKWLESQRSLHDFPLLLVSPFAVERACRYLPNEILNMLLQSGGGWSEDFFQIDEIEGETQTLKERVLASFIESVAKFLIPNILLSSSDEAPMDDGDNHIDATKYLSECVLILTGVDSDESRAKVLCNHIADLYGFVAVLAENGDATLECEQAFKFLKRCVSSVHIERTGAKGAFLVLRHILLLHRKGISVVGLDNIELNSSSFIEGMKYVSKQLKAPSSTRKKATFLEQLGSSMTESIVLVKYWLSSSLTTRQRGESWGTLSLLCDILVENIESGKVESGELGFCLQSFIAIFLDPANSEICPHVLESLKAILKVLFSDTAKETLVDGAIAVIQKLSLALLQTHQRAYKKLYTACVSSLCCLEYEQKSSQGLLSAFRDGQSYWDSLGESPWKASSNRDDVLKHLIVMKADIEENLSSDTMLGAYECLDILANSGKMQIDDILGADDIVLQCNEKEEIFRSVNEKYSMLTFFNSVKQRSTNAGQTNLDIECDHFIRIMNEHPISDELESVSTYASHDVLARLLALRRLEKALFEEDKNVTSSNKSRSDVYSFLLSICHSGEPEESRVISSRCLGELNLPQLSLQQPESANTDEVHESLSDPMLSIKRTILTMLGQYLLSGCAETSLVAMKTAKALLVTPSGKDCWLSLDGDIKALLSPFNTVDDGKLRREAVRVSESCLDRLKHVNGSLDSNSWCWNDELWTCTNNEENSYDLFIRKITSSIINCCFGKGSKVSKGDQDFFWICQGLCAKEASFASSVFPALIFHLLDSEARDDCKENGSVRDVIMSNNAIGSPTSEMNTVISRCFSCILSPKSNHPVSPEATKVVLNTLELLRAITEHRFLTSTDHTKNKSSAAQKQSSSLSKKRRSRNASDAGDINVNEISQKWRGFPYGVVLRVSGLDVARACYRVKRFYSALYYAEMSMQNLIGSGTFFEDVASDAPLKRGEFTVCDISGFGVLSQQEGTSDSSTILEKALLAKEVIENCLAEIHAQDEQHGVLSQGSALNLKSNITSLTTLEGCRRDQTFSMLLDLDTELQTSASPGLASSGTDARSGFSGIASCLEDLGLNHIKHHYLAGMENRLSKDQMTTYNRQFLREKWFEDALNSTIQWDDTLLPQTTNGETLTLTEMTLMHPAGISRCAPPLFDSQPGYYEAVHETLQSFARNDNGSALGHILQARKSVLSGMEYLAGSEAQSTGMMTHLLKLNMLGQLELVAKTLEGKFPPDFLLKRWGLNDSAGIESVESLLMNDSVNLDTKEQVVDIDPALFGSIRADFSAKEIALKILKKKLSANQEGMVNAISSHIARSCKSYRELGHPDAAKVSLSSLRSLIQKLGTADNSLPLVLRMEDAKIMKSRDIDGAIMHCKMIANHLINSANPDDIERDHICAESLLLGGLWMAQNNVDSAETILSSYFEKAARLAMKIYKRAPSDSSVQSASISNFKLGEFAANLYNSVDARISSEAWKRRNAVAKERKKELQAVAKLQKRSRSNNADDARLIHHTLSKECEMDDREVKSVEKSIRRYLHLAVESYCSALKLCPTTMSDGVSKHIYKLLSLWFKNCQRKETKDIVNGLLESNISQIPSYRFVPLTYQLFSRIDEMQEDGNSGFQHTLRKIVLKICSDHPYHGIVQILALSNGQRVGGGVNGRHANAYLENIGTAKVDAATSIIQEIRKHAPEYVSGLIDSYTTLMNSYIHLAEFDTTNVQKKATKGLSFKQYKLDLDSCLFGGRRGNRTSNSTTINMPAIITKPPPVRPDAQYGNGTEDPVGTERIVGFDSMFDLTLTGLHRPKIVKCLGSKGSRFKQLVKGEDDLRQDAIMQQVFGTVNDLLRHEGSNGNEFIKNSIGISSTLSTRQLRLITYGITPLSPASGVLEWVDNTMCFGDFLTDRGKKIGAHSKYFPGEWGSSEVREFYRNATDAHNATRESKRKAFDIICQNFSPAFRFFFLEYFKSSMEAWHTARTLYTRSCAVNSIVGHILGIGDRHTSNILVHTKTGEVVHIDFGIVFEQGKTLTTPELVPFRLTRDIVDGMGPSGTDGVFSKAAEATMSVMRNNADTLLTILSAVVSDPLYKWSLSPLKANQHQRKNEEDDSRNGLPSAWMASSSDENRNDAADRAIAKIHEKLEGYEDGTSGEHKTVAGQVKLLINEARDPGNLSVMFNGWAPWM